jgi:hypothetical protein
MTYPPPRKALINSPSDKGDWPSVGNDHDSIATARTKILLVARIIGTLLQAFADFGLPECPVASRFTPNDTRIADRL